MSPAVVAAVSKQLALAIGRSVEALKRGEVEQEPAMTDRMLGAITERLSDFSSEGVKWSAKTLTDRGRGAQETRFGADFMGVLDVRLPDFKVTKGFLAQAKLLKVGRAVDSKGLREQCQRMLRLSDSSFVFLYSKTGVQVVYAREVVSSELPLSHLPSRSARAFFEDHLNCHDGDTRIRKATSETLDGLATRYQARDLIEISARKVN